MGDALALVLGDRAAGLAAAHVDVYRVEPERIGGGIAPVRVLGELTGGFCPRAEGQIAVSCEPGIQVELAIEGSEPVVGEDDERRSGVAGLQRVADDAVTGLVAVLDGGAVVSGGACVVRGMPRVHGAPEHVLGAIAGGEVVEEQAALELVQRGMIDATGFIQDHAGLVEILAVVEDLRVQRVRVLGEPEGVEAAEPLRHLPRERGWSGDRKRGVHGVEVDGAGVEPEVRAGLFQVKAKDPAHGLDARHHRELHWNPVAPLAHSQQQLAALDRDLGEPVIAVDREVEVEPGVGHARAQRVAGPDESALRSAVAHAEAVKTYSLAAGAVVGASV